MRSRDSIAIVSCGTGTLAGACILKKETKHRQECLCDITIPCPHLKEGNEPTAATLPLAP